ncbi:MAG: DNA adenine methylase [Rhodospirillales bacterium]
MADKLMPVTPVLPVAPYIGGKRNLAKRLCQLIESLPHKLYAEPFVGMGGIFLRRELRPKAEVINDRSREVANLFRIIQRHYVPFLQILQFQLTIRAEFERLVRTDPETLTDLERAARFLYLQRTGFGGKVPGTASFGVSPDRPARFDVTKVGPMLEDLHARLADVTIECLDFGEFLTRYDRTTTLFYLDPPYWGCESDYGKALFSRADFERLRDVLRGLKGSFIMSLNDVEPVREMFAEFDIEAVETTYSIAKAGNKRVGEVIIRGGAKI